MCNDTENNPQDSEGGGGEVLVVASKVKTYIRGASGGMNTSASVFAALSDKLRRMCDDAIVRAKADGRKTVMDRDFA
ncbi:MAG: hypothetical protein AAB425_09490 [Bdellovibrionota bacterium]